MVARDVGLDRGQRLVQRREILVEVTVVLFLAQLQFVFVGVGLFGHPDHFRRREVHPILLIGGLSVRDVGRGQFDRRSKLRVQLFQQF